MAAPVRAIGRPLRSAWSRVVDAIGSWSRRTKAFVATTLAGLVALGAIVAVVAGGTPPTTITARFTTAPGLYPGNQVDVLGLPVGKVTSVTPGPAAVSVVLQVPSTVHIPAGAHAVIMAPQVVNDRYVQLVPAYTSGPTMADHAVIPSSRTAVPISVDAIVDSLDQLSRALGPNGANAHGALSDFFASSAKSFGGNGAALHATLTSLGNALGALSSRSPQLTALFDNLGNLSHVASRYTGTYQAFADDLATVSTSLASDDGQLGSALANLQHVLRTLATFTRTNASALGTSVANLNDFAGAVAAQQSKLAAAYRTLPIALENVTAAVDQDAPGGPALRARLDPMGSSKAYSTAVCGNALLRLLLLSIDRSQDKDPNVDLGCGVNGVLANLPTPPGASSGPALSLDALLGGGR
jgi:phospholipid/cholesterol/gamma-HCH transport system substrate-binding protein